MNELLFWETSIIWVTPFLGIWLANRLGQRPEWCFNPQAFLKYSFAAVAGGIILPAVTLWMMAGFLWSFLLLMLLIVIDFAVYTAQKKKRIRKREDELAFLRSTRERGEDDSPFGFLHLQ